MARADSFVVIGAGPSLTRADCVTAARAQDRGLCTIIAVNDAYRMCVSAKMLYACDHAWWRYHCQQHTRTGEFAILALCPDAERWTGEPMAVREFGCRMVNLRAGDGIAPEGADYVMRGHGSGFQAVGLAIMLGAKRVALLGMDCKRSADGRSHWFGEHPPELPNPQPFELWAREFDSLAEPARQRGIEIVNCTRDTAISALPRMSIDEWVARLTSG